MTETPQTAAQQQFIEQSRFRPQGFESAGFPSAANAQTLLRGARKLGMEGKLYEVSLNRKAHVYVVLDGMSNPDLPLNGIQGLDVKVGYVVSSGRDVTAELMGPDWLTAVQEIS